MESNPRVSIVGFSNWFMSSLISPSLTTMEDQPGFGMEKNLSRGCIRNATVKSKDNFSLNQVLGIVCCW
jgi:LacI family transcriptional regulator